MGHQILELRDQGLLLANDVHVLVASAMPKVETK